ncbi:MAG: pilus assembly protein [Pirellulaceae bacterium]|nr:pilus assembly protein [Pirellulaceae bacterium]
MRKRNHHVRHRAAATIELAVCLPLIMLVTFGGIEAASFLFTKQTMVCAAYEGIKVAVQPGASLQDVTDASQAVLDGRLLKETEISVNPENLDDVPRGGLIELIITAPGDANSIISMGPFKGKQLSVSAVMVKE